MSRHSRTVFGRIGEGTNTCMTYCPFFSHVLDDFTLRLENKMEVAKKVTLFSGDSDCLSQVSDGGPTVC